MGRVPPLSLLLLCATTAVTFAFDYVHEGHDWGGECEHARYESPIDITPDTAVPLPKELDDLFFHNYEISSGLHFSLQNNGHTLLVLVEGEGEPPWAEAEISQLHTEHDTYRLQHFHFHWGERDDVGSEHTIDGVHAPLELHMVHWNTVYDDIETASTRSDGLLVLSILFKLVDGEYSRDDAAPWMREIVENIPSVLNANDSHKIPLPSGSFDHRLRDLIPHHDHRFFRYFGSLTTPPCSESVTWFIFHDRLEVTNYELEQFRKLRDDEGRPIENNHRDVNNHNGRYVYTSSEQGAAASTIPCLSLNFIVLNVIVLLWW